MLHIRDLKPDEPEMVPEDDIPYIQLFDDKGKALDEWIHFDPATGHAVKGPKPKKPKMVPTGSMKHVDFDCEDCGWPLVNGNVEPFRYMVCNRLGTVDPELLKNAPMPKPDSVIECGRVGLDG